MYIILLTFSENKSSASQHMGGHKAWIDKGVAEGIFLVVGSLQPNLGGAIITHGITPEALAKRLSEDPFVAEGVVKADVMKVTPSITDDRLRFLLDG